MPAHAADEPRMGEDEADQQRLLLARRGHARPGCPSGRGGPGGRRPAARRGCGRRRGRAGGRRAGSRGSGPPRRPPAGVATSASISPSRRSVAKGKGEASSRVARIRRGEALRRSRARAAATAMASSATSRSMASSQRRVVGAVLEDPVARAQGPLERVRRARRARHRRPARAGRGSGGGRPAGRGTGRRDRASARRRADIRRRRTGDETGAPSMRQIRAARASPIRRARARCRGDARR